MRREIGGAEASERSAVGGEEEDRVIRLGRLRGRRRLRIGARQLEERGRSGPVVVRARARAAVVPVRDDHDDLVRTAFAERQQVFQLNGAAPGDFRVKTLALGAQPVLGKALGDPRCCVCSARSAGNAVGVRVHERASRQRGCRTVEVRLQRRSAQRPGVRHGERRDEERDPDEQPRAPIHAAVHRPIERPRARPAPLPEGRVGGHARQV